MISINKEKIRLDDATCERLVFLSEFGGLIHDLGKLNELFIEKHKRDSLINYEHGNILEEKTNNQNLNEKKDRLKEILNEIKLFKEDLFMNQITNTKLYSFIKNHHGNIIENNPIIDLLRLSDKCDSKEDKGEAFNRQAGDKTFIGNAFGHEKSINVNYKNECKKLYHLLIQKLKNFEEENFIKIIKKDRIVFLEDIRDLFKNGVGMTARAANDVSLWEHSFMVASILRTLISESILKENFPMDVKLTSIKKIEELKPYRILSIGWNFSDFLSKSNKLQDIRGRIETIKIIKNNMKKKIESKWFLGNHIFENNESIHFLVPASGIELQKRKDITKQVYTIFNKYSDGHLIPNVYIGQRGSKLNILLPSAIINLKKKINAKHYQSNDLFFNPKWKKNWRITDSIHKLVCIQCGKGVGEDKIEGICETCKKLRELLVNKESKHPSQTKYLDEIAWDKKDQSYKKIALFSLSFDLTNWLNGKYVRSYFYNRFSKEKIDKLYSYYNSKMFRGDRFNENLIKDNLLELGSIKNGWLKNKSPKALKNAQGEIKKNIGNFENLSEFARNELTDIKKNLENLNEAIKNKDNENIEKIFKEKLNSHSIKKELRKKFKKLEHEVIGKKGEIGETRFKRKREIIKKGYRNEILDFLLKKPSPSRLMRVWNNTLEFFKELKDNFYQNSPDIERFEYNLVERNENSYKHNYTYKCKVECGEKNQKGEIIFQENKLITITPHLNTLIKENIFNCDFLIDDIHVPIKKNGGNMINVKAFRSISFTPNHFLFFSPASKSLEFLNEIYLRFQKRFGKVYGKLPLNIGVTYFKRKTPLSYVLECARRFREGFDKMHHQINRNGKNPSFVIKKIEDNSIMTRKNNYKIRIPKTLGNGEVDYYHPYLMVKDGGEKSIQIKINNHEINQKHFSNIKEEEEILFHPSFFDFQYLDSNINRFDISYGTTDEKHDLTGWKRQNYGNLKEHGGNKLFILEDLQKFNHLKDFFHKVESWTLIKDIEELIKIKLKEWFGTAQTEFKQSKTYNTLIESVLENKINKDIKKKFDNWKKEKDFIKNCIYDGIFFNAIQQFHTIMNINLEENN